MPLLGSHTSISGGYYRSLEIARDHQADAVQLFTKNNNQWRGKPITDEDLRLFHDLLKETGLKLPMAHDSYLINLASPDDTLRIRSLDAFTDEVERAEALGLSYLVMHPGTPTDGDEAEGLNRIGHALQEVLHRTKGYQVMVLLETTAGQGKSLGHRFEHLAGILDRLSEPERVGVCMDTCHVFAAGYALAPEPEYQKTFAEFDRIVGLSKLLAFHVNDSKKPLGSRVDRHEHIGRGCLGLEPFRLLLNDPRFAGHPMVLETPKEDGDEDDMDTINLGVLRGLLSVPQKKPRPASKKAKEPRTK